MRTRSLLSTVLLALAGCGQSGQTTANVVQAASKGAAEIGKQLAEKAAALAQMTPEEAKAKLQELVDAAATELKEVRDSETAQKIASEVQKVFAQLQELGLKLSQKLNLAGLQQSVEELIERFKNEPHVVSALKSLQEMLNSLSR
jgi:polyhydroxyalkanoate synthesis regulator phasin